MWFFFYICCFVKVHDGTVPKYNASARYSHLEHEHFLITFSLRIIFFNTTNDFLTFTAVDGDGDGDDD